MIDITIFTPTYNRKETLKLAYLSLKKQTTKNFKWLIIDDGSKDNTEKIVNNWKDEGVIRIEYIKTRRILLKFVEIYKSKSILIFFIGV